MGARVMKRVITEEIKTSLADEVLFGALKQGGVCTIDLKSENCILVTVAKIRLLSQLHPKRYDFFRPTKSR